MRGKGGGKVRVTPQTSVTCEYILLELSTHRIKLLLASFKYPAFAAKKEFSLHRMRRGERFSFSFEVWERKREKLSQKLLRRGWGKSCRWVADRKKQVYSWSRFLSLSFLHFHSLSFFYFSLHSCLFATEVLFHTYEQNRNLWSGWKSEWEKNSEQERESELFSLSSRENERERREREREKLLL